MQDNNSTSSSFSNIDPKSLSRGHRIRFLREKKGWTQEELGKKMNIDGTHISKWENDAGIRSDNLVKLASVFETSVEFLNTGKEPPIDDNIDDLTEKASELVRILTSDKSSEPAPDDRIQALELAQLMIGYVLKSLKN